jgi:hypothetical protein
MKKKTTTVPELPGRDERDAAYTGAMMLTKLIPYVGGAAAEWWGARIAKPVDRRRTEWFSTLREAVLELQEERKIDLDQLGDDDAFASVVMGASLAAAKTHQREKHEALKNCVLNAALGAEPDASIRQIFIDLVDRFTPLHLKLLHLFSNPRAYEAVARRFEHGGMGGLIYMIQTAFPELAGQDAILRVVWGDLEATGFVSKIELGLTMSGSGLLSKRTTDLGDRFVSFVCISAL